MMSVGSIVAFRIIPARAGFTRDVGPRSHEHRDHPRSRGVYATTRPVQAPRSWQGPPDHPRSRGVYTLPSAATKNAYGSSPLARGLPSGLGLEYARDRIIPARAGFTDCPPRAPVRPADHPRSRGVYVYMWMNDQGMTGSSPLARGLRKA